MPTTVRSRGTNKLHALTNTCIYIYVFFFFLSIKGVYKNVIPFPLSLYTHKYNQIMPTGWHDRPLAGGFIIMRLQKTLAIVHAKITIVRAENNGTPNFCPILFVYLFFSENKTLLWFCSTIQNRVRAPTKFVRFTTTKDYILITPTQPEKKCTRMIFIIKITRAYGKEHWKSIDRRR